MKIEMMILAVLITIVELNLFGQIGESYFGKKKGKIGKQEIIAGVGLSISTLLNLLYIGVALRIIIYMYLSKKRNIDNPKTPVLWGMCMGIMIGILTIGITYGLEELVKGGAKPFGGVEVVAIGITYMTMELILMQIKNKENKEKTFSFLGYGAGITLLLIGVLFLISQREEGLETYVLIGVECVILVSQSYLIRSYEREERKEKEKNKEERVKEKSEQDLKYYQGVKEEEEKYTAFVENTRHQLQRLLNYFVKKEYQLAHDYLLNSKIKVKEKENQVYTENKVLNFIVNEKEREVRKKKIKLYADLKGMEFTFLSELELYMLFENLLDFGIKKIEQTLKEEKRNLYLTSIYLEEEAHYGISISSEDKLKEERKIAFPYQEKERQNYLLYGVEKVAEEKGGFMMYEEKGGYFSATVVIKNADIEEKENSEENREEKENSEENTVTD